MKGLSNKAVELIDKMISDRFDSTSMDFLGMIPKISRSKRIVFSSAKNNLTALFIDSLGTIKPNKDEEDVLKVILRIANGYVDSLKSRTKSRIIQNINSYMIKQNNSNKPVSLNVTKKIFRDEMDKAGKHLKMIVNSESNKTANMGTALQIAKVGEANGEEDPTVFFIVVVDDVTGSEEFRLHLLPDRKTPRVWKLSEIGGEYHKKGDPTPKVGGLHPSCRCKITYLAKGFGFKDGKVTYISADHDEFEEQRKNS